MSFRGRGRGRGRGWGREASLDARHGKTVEYILFPEDVNLPSLPTMSKNDILLCKRILKLESFWKGSCYHLEDSFSETKKDDREIERYSDSLRKDKKIARENFAAYMKLTPSNFPSELIQGMQGFKRPRKKLRWDKDAAKKLDLLEKLDNKIKDEDEEGKKKKTDSDEEAEKEETEGEEEDEGDYEQNIDFDDDEDDMNIEDEPAEDTYED